MNIILSDFYSSTFFFLGNKVERNSNFMIFSSSAVLCRQLLGIFGCLRSNCAAGFCDVLWWFLLCHGLRACVYEYFLNGVERRGVSNHFDEIYDFSYSTLPCEKWI